MMGTKIKDGAESDAPVRGGDWPNPNCKPPSELSPAHGSAGSVQRIGKFLRVVSDASMPDERGVMSNDNKLIAIIGYYKPWREWVLYPEPKTVWSTECLAAINDHLARMGGRPNDTLCRPAVDAGGAQKELSK